MSALIVLVSSVPRALRRVDAILSDTGYLVAAVPSPAEAQYLLDSVTPDLLLVDLRLNAAGNARLVMRSRLERPALPVIVAHESDEMGVDGDAMRLGVEFVRASAERQELLQLVGAAIERHRRAQPPVRRWSRQPAPGPVRVRAGDAPAHVVDTSHGGVRLEMEEGGSLPAAFDIVLPQTGATIRARRAWLSSPTDEPASCGAEIDEAARHAWRHFVESLSPAPRP